MKGKKEMPPVVPKKDPKAWRFKDRPPSSDLYRVDPPPKPATKPTLKIVDENSNPNERFTRAQLLREQQVIAKEQSAQIQKLNHLEQNLRSSQEFKEWQVRMREEDERKRFEEIEQKKKQLEVLFVQMQKAMKRRKQDNLKLAKQMKREKNFGLMTRGQEFEEELRQKRDMKKRVQSEQKKFEQVKEQFTEEKQKAALKHKEEIERMIKQRKIDDDKLLEQKRELIKQIRAFEAQVNYSANREKIASQLKDAYEDTIDIKVLKQIYDDLKVQFVKEAAERNEQINKAKRAEQQRLATIHGNILDQRAKRFKTNEIRRLERVKLERELAERQAAELEKKEKATLAKILHKKISKNQEISEIKQQEHEQNLKKLFFNQEKEKYERIKNENIDIRKENVVKESQASNINNAYLSQMVRDKEHESWGRYRSAEARKCLNIYSNYDRVFQKAKERAGMQNQVDQDMKFSSYLSTRNFEKHLRDKMNVKHTMFLASN
jgi:hypothetical protein